jgi:hypothetical protein
VKRFFEANFFPQKKFAGVGGAHDLQPDAHGSEYSAASLKTTPPFGGDEIFAAGDGARFGREKQSLCPPRFAGGDEIFAAWGLFRGGEIEKFACPLIK